MTGKGCNRKCCATWYVLAIIIAIVNIIVVIIVILHELRICFANHRWEFHQGLGLAVAKQLDVKYQLELCNQLESESANKNMWRSTQLCTCPCSYQQ